MECKCRNKMGAGIRLFSAVKMGFNAQELGFSHYWDWYFANS